MTARKKNYRDAKNQIGFESLEQRQLLAFDFLFDGTTLTLNQTIDDGIIQIDNSGPANEFQVNDGAGFVTYEAATDVEINLLDNGDHMTLSLNQPHTGDLAINLGDGSRSVIFASAGNTIDGDLEITAGTGQQTLSLSQISTLEVNGSVTIDTGLNTDSLNLVHPLRVGNDLNMTNVTEVYFGDALNVGGNVTVDNSLGNDVAVFEKLNGSPSLVLGGFVYMGGDEVDQIQIQDTVIQGDVEIDFADGFSGGAASQMFSINQVETGNLGLTYGDSGNPDINTWSNVVIRGDVSIDMGDGLNSTGINGAIEGTNFIYQGGNGADVVVYDLSGGTGQNIGVDLGAGIDNFTIFDGSTVENLNIDFGNENDFFNNGVGNFTFNARLIDMDGFDVEYVVDTDTLSILQRTDGTSANLELHSDAVSERFIFDTNELTNAANLFIQMNDNNLGSLDLFLEHTLAGNLDIDLGDGPRMVDFRGAANAVGGNMSIAGGDNNQEISPDQIAQLVIQGDATIDLGSGLDTLSTINSVFVNSSLNLVGVNMIDLDSFVEIGGDLIVDVSTEDIETKLDIKRQMYVDGELKYLGGSAADWINFDPIMPTEIAGDLTADFGASTSGGDQLFLMNSATRLFGNVTVLSSSDAISDVFRSDTGSIISGDVLVDFGDGINVGNFGHDVDGGKLLKFVSGSGSDEVFLKTDNLETSYNIIMGEGNDRVTLEASTNVGDMLRIDFGGGNDELFNNKGAFAWDTRILNFHGINSFYDPVEDSLNLVQVDDLADVAIDNNGTANAIQVDVQGPGAYELTPVTNLRLNMMPNSTSNVAVHLDAPLAGDLILNLQHGDREVFFTGNTNTVNGDLRIVSGDGSQDLHLAENNPLIVSGETVINTRDGVDTLDDGGQFLTFLDNLILRNVDDFEVTNNMYVGGNMTMVSHWHTQDTRFDNDGVIEIVGKLTYLGSDGSDNLLLNGDVTIGDDIYIDLAENTTSGLGQNVLLSEGFEALDRIHIHGGTSFGGNNVTTDSTTRLGGDVIIDFSKSATNNTAILKGNFSGDYGTFRGGQADDILEFDAIAEDMGWVTLMHDGNDEVMLGSDSKLLNKLLDFGFGNDLFDDEHLEAFPLTVLNL